MTAKFDDLIAITERWVKGDPRWERFQRSFGKGWDLTFVIMDDTDERICWGRRMIYLAMFRWPDPLYRAAHAAAHVKAHWGAEYFTEAQCEFADEWATYMLAMTDNGSRPPVVA